MRIQVCTLDELPSIDLTQLTVPLVILHGDEEDWRWIAFADELAR